MKIAVLGGGGAMGGAFGAVLIEGGHDVTLVDVNPDVVGKINDRGLQIDDRSGASRRVPARATRDPKSIGVCDLVVNFVKCYHTEAAVTSALPLLGTESVVLTLQNGWGNAPKISHIVGAERVLMGVSYHSATVRGHGHLYHAGRGLTFLGEIDGPVSPRVQKIADALNAAGWETTATDRVLDEIWKKLALNVVTLPTSASIRVTVDRLLETPELQDTMQELLSEAVSVAVASGISLSFDERWEAITDNLQKLASGTKSSMLQDIENKRKTEIDVINGAISSAGKKYNIKTPVNNAMIGLIKGLEVTF